jgi:long-chain acyl-CoA synthetase
MEKPWLQNYPEGVPSEINPECYRSLPELFLASCELFAEKPALCHRGTQLSYQRLKQYAQSFMTFLQSLKVAKGERIVLMMPNSLQYPVCLWGGLMTGLVIVNVNPLCTAAELAHQLADAKPAVIVVSEFFAATVEEALKTVTVKHVIITKFGDLFPGLKGVFLNGVLKYIKRLGKPYHLPKAIAFKLTLRNNHSKSIVIEPDDLAFLQYTGGTTGVPKAAMLTHRNIVANVEQVRVWLHPLLREGREVLITALPLYHIFGLTVNGILCCRIGAMSLLISNPKDIKSLIKEIKPYKFTAFLGVNALFNALLQRPAFCKLNFSDMRLSLGGGAQIQEAVATHWQAVTGHPLLEGYGLTEASPVVAVNPLSQADHNGSVGFALPSTDVKVIDEAGVECAVNEPGELCVRGPQVMLGYWQQPAETQAVLSPEGWLKTGDIATLDVHGYIRIVDRKKDMIIVSGFKVYPNEVENVIASLAGVSEVAVAAILDAEKGERVKAYVVKHDESLTQETVRAHCRSKLTAYKVPSVVEFVQALPKSAVGKVLRRKLSVSFEKTERKLKPLFLKCLII